LSEYSATHHPDFQQLVRTVVSIFTLLSADQLRPARIESVEVITLEADETEQPSQGTATETKPPKSSDTAPEQLQIPKPEPVEVIVLDDDDDSDITKIPQFVAKRPKAEQLDKS
jgi:hypothetical protein